MHDLVEYIKLIFLHMYFIVNHLFIPRRSKWHTQRGGQCKGKPGLLIVSSNHYYLWRTEHQKLLKPLKMKRKVFGEGCFERVVFLGLKTQLWPTGREQGNKTLQNHWIHWPHSFSLAPISCWGSIDWWLPESKDTHWYSLYR